MNPNSRARRRLAIALIVVVGGCLAGPGLIQALAELRRGERPQALDLLTTPPSQDALRAFEAELERRSLLVEWARRTWAPLVDRTLERGSTQVQMGTHSWLFYRDAVRWVTGPAFQEADAGDSSRGALRAIADTAAQLGRAGIELVLVPTPAKATLYPDRLRRGVDALSAPNNPGYSRFLEAVRGAGVAVVDPTAALLAERAERTPVFLERDTHWSPQGMRRTAELVAAWIERRGVLAAVRREPFDHRLVEFEVTGDLVEMLPYPGARAGYDAVPVLVDQVIRTRSGKAPIQRDSPVLVLGDSATLAFSRPELGLGRRGGFGEHLADLLHVPVDVIAVAGGGATRVRETLALRPGGLVGKRVVVWQFSQRDLMLARDGWRPVSLERALRAPEPGSRTEAGPASAEALVHLRAEVIATTPVPDLFDYPDCLIMIRYRPLERIEALAGESFVVAHWGWRDWRAQPAAGLRPGDVLELELGPLPARWALDRTCWHDDVGLDRAPWWPLRVAAP